MEQMRQVFCKGALARAKRLTKLFLAERLAQALQFCWRSSQLLHHFFDIGAREVG